MAARAEPAGWRIGLSRRAAAEICQVVHAEVRGDFAQARPAGGEESAEEAALAEFLEPGVPAFHGAAEAFEDSRDLGRDRGFAVPEEPAGVIDQDEVASQGEIFQHPFT